MVVYEIDFDVQDKELEHIYLGASSRLARASYPHPAAKHCECLDGPVHRTLPFSDH